MANLIKLLRGQGFDYIDGPIRDHKVLQVWIKKDFDKTAIFDMLDDLFKSPIVLIPYETPALFVNYSSTAEYNINVGITALEQLLKAANLGEFGLSTKIKSGISVSIAYDNAKAIDYAYGNLSNYFYDKDSDFKYINPELFTQANRNNLVIITGILFAQNLEVHIKTSNDLDTKLGSELTNLANGKIDFSLANSKEIVMKSDLGVMFPIAVKAFRLNFDKGKYISMKLVTDSRDFF